MTKLDIRVGQRWKSKVFEVDILSYINVHHLYKVKDAMGTYYIYTDGKYAGTGICNTIPVAMQSETNRKYDLVTLIKDVYNFIDD